MNPVTAMTTPARPVFSPQQDEYLRGLTDLFVVWGDEDRLCVYVYEGVSVVRQIVNQAGRVVDATQFRAGPGDRARALRLQALAPGGRWLTSDEVEALLI